jgi:SWI/SNF-related matrix-associated actin-dependent regulator of chromatin subfamily D
MYKTRLDIQENLIMPTPKVKALLRTHIFSYFANPIPSSIDDSMFIEESGLEKNLETYSSKNQTWILRIQGKIMPVLESQPGGFFRKFSYFFHKIQIKFDSENSTMYSDIEWTRSSGTDTDGFEIKRECRLNETIKIKILFFLNSYTQECKVSDELANIIGITQETRPKILFHLWQYIKMNSLQDNDNPNIIINNKELRTLFKCDKMDITSLYPRLADYIRPLDPLEIEYEIKPIDDWTSNQKLFDFVVNIDDPHFLDISNFLSNIDNESLLFPKNLFFYKNENQQKTDKLQTNTEKFYNKIQEIDRSMSDLNEKLKKHKYKYEFYEAFSKDPVKFVNNFTTQQSSLLKIMKEESSIIDARWDYNSANYYKDYEEVLREYVDSYLNRYKNDKN